MQKGHVVATVPPGLPSTPTSTPLAKGALHNTQSHPGAYSTPYSTPDIDIISNTCLGNVVTFTADTFVELISNRNPSLLVLDCRSFVAFNKEHIDGAVNLTCPTLLIKRMQQQKLANGMRKSLINTHTQHLQHVQHAPKINVIERLISAPEVREICRKGSLQTVVLYDDSVIDPRYDNTCALYTVMQLLEDEGPIVGFLQGGFSAFAERHPTYCFVQCPSTIKPCLSSPPRSALLRKENMDMEPIEILPFLFLGNKRNSSDLQSLNDLGITYILNVAKECQNSLDCVPGFVFKNVALLDTTEQDIHPVLEDCFGFIETARCESGNVLVHCVGGISRSVTVTLAYLIRSQHMSLDEAYRFIKVRKTNISPNLSFMGQLLEFERREIEGKGKGERSEVLTGVTEIYAHEEDDNVGEEEEGERDEVVVVDVVSYGANEGKKAKKTGPLYNRLHGTLDIQSRDKDRDNRVDMDVEVGVGLLQLSLENNMNAFRLDSPTTPISVGESFNTFRF